MAALTFCTSDFRVQPFGFRPNEWISILYTVIWSEIYTPFGKQYIFFDTKIPAVICQCIVQVQLKPSVLSDYAAWAMNVRLYKIVIFHCVAQNMAFWAKSQNYYTYFELRVKG